MPEVGSKLIAACVQMSSGDAKQANLEKAARLIEQAAGRGAQLVLLPENCAFMGQTEQEKRVAAEGEADSPTLAFLSGLAKRYGILLVGGTILLRGKGERLRNASPAFLPDGRLAGIYDKMHLFDVVLPEEQHTESKLIEPGGSPATVESDVWKLGLSVCYDLRFPELYRHYAMDGCNILTVPAAFTVPTGKAHWQTLLKARAIENQCYVLAAGQCGEHPGKRRTYGHSMIVDPWGTVLAELGDDEGIAIAELSLDTLSDLRRRMPVLQHRRM
ncbi:MAG TPA: carbon-nitrogen hydrolase family protein [Mariprofundaceae bacterium]|nr:carbon-nitrogen hydrolase family protein [Mariprofundaceae bacterium]